MEEEKQQQITALQAQVENLDNCIATLDRIKDAIFSLEDKKVKEMFYAKQAKEKGDRDKYLQHYWSFCAYGLALQNLTSAVVGVGNV